MAPPPKSNTKTAKNRADTAIANDRNENGKRTPKRTPDNEASQIPPTPAAPSKRQKTSKRLKAVKKEQKSKAAKQTQNNNYATRRILAERRSTAAKGKKEYLVDWFPSWEPEANLKNERDIMEEWAANKKSYTFKYGSKTVAKCENPTSDEAEEQCRLMFDMVTNELKKWLMDRKPEQVAQDLFSEEEWIFADNEQGRMAAQLAEAAEEPTPDAAGVMRRTYIAMRKQSPKPVDTMNHLTKSKNRKQSSEPVEPVYNLIYGEIRVRYLGQVDDKFPIVTDAHDRAYARTKTWLYPLIHTTLYTIEPEKWEKTEHLHVELKSLDAVADLFVKKSPFLLKKTHVWPLFFTRLFIMSDKIEEMLKERQKSVFSLNEDWAEETRDWLLQAYSAAFDWEARAVESIERTYLHCRDLVKDLVVRVPKTKGHRNKAQQSSMSKPEIMSVVQRSEEAESEEGLGEVRAYETKADEMDVDDEEEDEED